MRYWDLEQRTGSTIRSVALARSNLPGNPTERRAGSRVVADDKRRLSNQDDARAQRLQVSAAPRNIWRFTHVT